MTEIVSKPDLGDQLVNKEGVAIRRFQIYLDDLTIKLNQFLLGDRVIIPTYTVATVPDATTSIGWIFVSDESGGAVPAFSDGTNWRRSTDRAIIS